MKLSLFEVLGNLAKSVGAPRVLCADDDADVRQLCTSALTRAGFVPDIAADGREVLEKIADNEYAAILLDLSMPAIHGTTVLSLIQRDRPELLARIVVVTGMPDAVVDPVRNQVAAVVRKPVSLADLLAEVNKCSTKVPKRRGTESDATVRL